MRPLALASLALVTALAACDPGGDNDKATGCTAPLSEYCAKYPCPSYDDAAAKIRAMGGAGQFCFYAAIGTCGATRYTMNNGGLGGTTMYFDANGQLVGIHVSTDTNAYCNGTAFSRDYGDVPTCQMAVGETLCDYNHLDSGTGGG